MVAYMRLRIVFLRSKTIIQGWVEEALACPEQVRECKWTESIAFGSRDFVDAIKRGLGVKAKGRLISGTGDESALREPQADLELSFLGQKHVFKPTQGIDF
jgi:hypothetical protein